MIAPLIDIPPGLEDAYYKVVSFLGGNNPDTIISKKQSPARSNFSVVANRSLFVKWKSLWRGFDSSRKMSWAVYWATLPFGDHGGANGWPGSGYSAFVYVNAPRYHAGLDLLLDPPATDGILRNPHFSGNADEWVLSSEFEYFSDSIRIHGVQGGAALTYQLHQSITNGASYHLKFDMKWDPALTGYFLHANIDMTAQLGDAGHSGPDISIDAIPDNTWRTYEFDFTSETDEDPPIDTLFGFRLDDMVQVPLTFVYFDNFILTLNP